MEARFRSPVRLVLNGNEARCVRRSPTAGDVTFRIRSLGEAASLAVEEDPVHLRYKNAVDRELWKERYHTDDVVLSTFVARRAQRLEAGEGVRLTHVAQACGPGEAPVRLLEKEGEVCLVQDETSRRLETLPVRTPAAGRLTGDARSDRADAALVFTAGDRIRAIRPLADGSVVVGAESGGVTFLDPDGRPVWSEALDAPLYDVGAAEGEATSWRSGTARAG